MRVRNLRDLADVGQGERLAHRMSVGVLYGNEAGDRLVKVARVAEGVAELGEVPGAVGALRHLLDRRADDYGMAGLLVRDDVGGCAGDRLLAAAKMPELSHEVAHGPARHEQGRFLAEQLRGPLFEGVDGGVVAEDVVAELGIMHGPAHRRRRMSDCVAAQIDEAAAAIESHDVEYRSTGSTGGSQQFSAAAASRPPGPTFGHTRRRMLFSTVGAGLVV